MIKLVTTSEILSSILENRGHLWHEILKSQPIKTLYLLNQGWFTPSDMNPLFVWITAKNIEVVSSEESTVKIKEANEVKELDAFYLLDLTSEEADCISTKSGVYCASVTVSPKTVLNYSNFVNTWEKNQGEYKWKNWPSVFSKRYHGPSNALVIVDRWFFDDVKRPKVELQKYNLLTILESILPVGYLACQYQILMFFEKPIQVKDSSFRIWCNSIIKIVKNVIAELKRSRLYDIYFEALVNLDFTMKSRTATHNRIMLTNYSYVGGQQEWKLFYQNEPQMETYLTFQEILYVNEDQKASENYLTKLSTLVDFTKDFFVNREEHIKKKNLRPFSYAWIINDKIFLLQQSSNGQTTGIKEIDENGNYVIYDINKITQDINEKIMIKNRIIRRLLC